MNNQQDLISTATNVPLSIMAAHMQAPTQFLISGRVAINLTDGSVEFAADYEPDAAAAEFWEALRRYAEQPMQETRGHAQRVAAALGQALEAFTHAGDIDGEWCQRTGWVPADRVAQWRAVLETTAPHPADTPSTPPSAPADGQPLTPAGTCPNGCAQAHMYEAGCLLDPHQFPDDTGAISHCRENGVDSWVWRCWGTHTCDGWLSFDHASAAAARRAYDRHVREHPLLRRSRTEMRGEHGPEPVDMPADTPSTPTREPDEADAPELTREDAIEAMQDMATDLYRAQDRIAFVREMLDAHTGPLTPERVRSWLDRPECPRAESEQQTIARLEAAAGRVRALAERWAALVPADGWGESVDAAVTADAGRAVLAALDARLPDDAERPRTTPDGEKPAKACEGFQWIGQPFYCCDNCGRPAWEHAGMHTFDRSKGLFGDTVGHVEPWKPGEADKIRARWEPVWHRNVKDGEQR